MASNSSPRRSPRLKRRLESSDTLAPSRSSKKIKLQAGFLEKYKYATLDADKVKIRLFSLLPGERDDPIRGSLTTVDLDTTPQYDALSYLWGDPRPVAKVFLSDGRYIMVADNLRKALISLRQGTQSRVLWIDAISINQKDVRERGHQVKLMGAVYAQARLVRVWLDVDVDISSRPFRLLTKLAAPVDKAGPVPPRHLVYNDCFSSFWGPVLKTFADPYWGRVWIQQELLLAQDIHFHLPAGPLPAIVLINFHHILEDAKALPAKALKILQASMGPCQFKHLQQRFLAAWPRDSFHGSRFSATHYYNSYLYHLFLSSRHLASSDSRDRVYAMLAIAKESGRNQPPIKPDYTLSLEQTYCELFKCHIQQYQTLNFLCCRGYKRYHSLPTWLPSPEKKSRRLRPALHLRLTGTLTADPHATISNAGILRVRGVRCDGIKGSTGVSLTHEPFLALPGRLREMCRMAGLSLPSLEQPMSVTSILGRLMLFKDVEVTVPNPFRRRGLTDSDIPDCFASFLEYISSSNNTHLTISNVVREHDRIQQKDFIFTRLLYHRFQLAVLVLTDEARIGVGYLTCPERFPEAGDQVWIILGCQMPIVLRPVRKRRSTRYQVIGPVVFPGLMRREVFDALENGSDNPAFQNLTLETVELI